MSSSSSAALTSLLRAASIQDHDEVLKAANAALRAAKDDVDAQQTRVVALLKLDRFKDALRAIAEGGDKLKQALVIERAYALYKTGQLEEAEELVKNTAAPGGGVASRGLQHLAAQIAYRAEKFEDAARLYGTLPGNGRSGEENDLRINTLATNAQLEWRGLGSLLDEEQRQPAREDLEAFETAYNAACGCVARGDLARASILLKRSRDLCEASDDLTEDEKKAELLPILVQHTYVLTRLGKEDEAAALQKLTTASDVPEAPTRLVAQNNELAAGAAQRNPFLTQRLLQTSNAAALSVNDKLFEYQASVLRRNAYAVELGCQKFDGVASATARDISKAGLPSASTELAELGVASAAARARLQSGKLAIKEILPVLEKRPFDIGLVLTIVQLYIQAQNPGPALSLLEVFLKRLEASTTPDHSDVRFAPGLVATVVALYRTQGRHNSIRTELAKAATHWRSRPKESSTSLLREAGIELLKSSSPDDLAVAGAAFEQLVARSSKDKAAIAGLVASFATSDYAKVEPHLQGLTPIDRLVAGTDVTALVDAGVASVAAPLLSKRKRGADATKPLDKPAKRRRRTRLPKSYEEGKQPDPERWLPLRDRSTYRPKGKKGKKRAQEATQGGAVKEEETLELVGGAGAVKVEKATMGGGGGGGNSKKKNKKKK